MAERQSHLNGAYYGPPIPPPKQKSYYRPGRGGGGDCFGCCFCCLFSLVFKLLLTIAVTIGLVVLIVWLIFRPHKVKFHVTEATLTQFNFTNNNNMHYHLALNLTIRNPNKRVGIYYDRIEARGYYEDERFGSVDLNPFYQGKKNTTLLHTTLSGQQLLVLDAGQVSKYDSQKGSGVYDIDVKLYLRVRFKVGWVKTWRLKPKIKCELKVPISNGKASSASGFQKTSCGVDF